MTSPLSGALVLTGWVAAAPTGHDEAFLLLTTPHHDAPQTMPDVAAVLGLTGPPGSASTNPDVKVTVGADRWITLRVGEQTFARPGGREWLETARRRGHVVLVVGTAPMPAGMSPDEYTNRHGATSRLGLVPVRFDDGPVE